MKINSSIIIGILNSVENNGVSTANFVKDEKSYQHVYKNEMTDASTFFQLVTDIRREYPDIETYAALIQYVNVLDIGILGHFIMTCKNIFVAYDRMIKYQLLISNYINMRYEHIDHEIHWILQMPYQLLVEKYNMEAIGDFELIFRLKIEESLSGRTPHPSRIELFQKTPELSTPRINYFSNKYNCDVVPNKSYNKIIYNETAINKKIPYKNFELYKYLDPLLLKKISDLYKRTEFKNSIKSILLNNTQNFPLTIDEVSKQLFMSSRKLQLILQKDNMSFQNILNEVKIIVAFEHLKRKKDIKETAYRLGYKEPNSFTRFFIQQTNYNPKEFLKLTAEKQLELSNKFT